MAAKKSFKENPAMQFISSAGEEKGQEAPQIGQQEGLNIPKGYVLTQEPKSQRVQLLIRPTTKQGIKEIAEAEGLSMNELINKILEDYLKGANK